MLRRIVVAADEAGFVDQNELGAVKKCFGSSARLGQAIAEFGHRKLLIVTDAVLLELGLMAPLTEALTGGGTPFVVFAAVTPDAPVSVLEQGIAVFDRDQCDGIVAFGGGSVIDSAKAIALACANARHPRELVGYFKGRHGPAPIYAVPTTAGTGSEVTVAAVISDPEHGVKLVIADTRLVPDMAALDPYLMTGLARAITAATGMDALTHAVEAFIGNWSTAYTDRMALAAVSMIYRYLPLACSDGANLEAREKMALAASFAGLAFTRANVGNVHAIAHQIGARYHTPHGLANAIVLPGVLRWCAAQIRPRLALLALRSGVGRKGGSQQLLARQFLDSVEALNAQLGIPAQLDALRAADIPELARAACREADTSYPVPQRMSRPDCEALLRALLPAKAARRPPARKPAAAKPPVAKPAAGRSGALGSAKPRPGARKPATTRASTPATAGRARAAKAAM